MSEEYPSSVEHAAKDYDMSLYEAQRIYDLSKAKGLDYYDELEAYIKHRATYNDVFTHKNSPSLKEAGDD